MSSFFRRAAGVRISAGWPGWLSFATVFTVAAVVVASGPVFVAAVRDVVAEGVVERATTLERSVLLRADVFIQEEEGARLAAADAAVAARITAIDGLEPGPTTFAIGDTSTSAASGDLTLGGTALIVSRDGALDALEPVAGGGADGAWVSARVARILDLAPGDTVAVGSAGFRIPVQVAGVYRDFDVADYGPYWSLLPLELLPREYRVFGGIIQPELFVVSEDALFAGLAAEPASRPAPILGRVWWQGVSAGDVVGAAGLSRLARGAAGIERDANDATTDLGGALRAAGIGSVRTTTSLVDIDAEVALAVERIEPAIAPVRVTGAVLGLAVIGLGAWFVARRRSVELRMWGIAGRSGIALGALAAVGTMPAAVAGTVLGAAAAPLLVQWIGPSQILHRDAMPVATVAAVGAAGLVIVAAVTAVAAARMVAARPAARWGRLAWEAALYMLAAVLLVQLVRRDPENVEPGTLDLATVLAPVAGAAALATLGGRGASAMMRRLRRRGTALPAGLFLAWRRMAAAAAGRIGVVLPVATAAGVALFSSLLVAAVDEGLEAKATVIVGSDVSSGLARVGIPDELPAGMTLVWTGSATRTATSRVMLMAIDTDTYRDAVRWDESFGVGVAELVALLDQPTDRVPVAVAGRRAASLPIEGSVRTQNLDLAYRRVAELDAVPGMSDFLPTMLVSERALWEWAQAYPEISRAGALGGTAVPPDPSVSPQVSGIETATVPFSEEGIRELLLGLSPRLLAARSVAEVEAFLVRVTQPTDRIETRADVLGDANSSAQRWAFDYLRLLAVAALAVSLAVLGFSMIEAQRRNVIAAALTARMGVRRVTSAAATAAEIAGLLVVALLLGLTAGWVLGAGFLGRFDPLPTFPPGLRTVTPLAAFGMVVLVVAVGGALVWLVSQRAAARADPAEVLRG